MFVAVVEAQCLSKLPFDYDPHYLIDAPLTSSRCPLGGRLILSSCNPPIHRQRHAGNETGLLAG